MDLPNIVCSLVTVSPDLLTKAHDSIHEFIYIAPLSLPPGASWHEKSAFLTYHFVAFHQAHRSLLEALAGYYNTAHVILRSVLEIVQKAPQVDEDFEKISAAIFDKIDPLFSDSELRKLIPKPKVIVWQLAEWGILEPYSAGEVYRIYRKLSAEVHVIPDKTDLGRRLLREKNIFEVQVIPEELTKYLEFLHKIMDISIVIELNILSDWIKQSRDNQELTKRLEVLKNLELRNAFLRLSALLRN